MVATEIEKLLKSKPTTFELAAAAARLHPSLDSAGRARIFDTLRRAAAHRDARAAASMRALAASTSREMDRLDAPDLVSVLLSIHAMQLTGGDWNPVWARALGAVYECCFELPPPKLAKLAYALALSGHASGPRGKRAFDAIADSVLQHSGELGASVIAPLAWSFAAAGHRSPRLFKVLAAETARHAGRLEPRELGSTAWAFATVGQECEVLFSGLATAAGGRFGSLDPRQHLDTASLLGSSGGAAQKRRSEIFWRKLGLEYGLAVEECGSSARHSAIAIDAVFRSFDKDLSGTLSMRELQRALRKLEVEPREDSAIFARYDLDGDGTIGLDEFRLLARDLVLPPEPPGKPRDVIAEILPGPQRFRVHNGTARKEDYDHYLESELEMRVRGAEMSAKAQTVRRTVDPTVRRAFTRFDADGNGKLDVEELRHALRALGLDADSDASAGVLKRYDENHDGKCNLIEFSKIVRDIEAHAKREAAQVDSARANRGSTKMPTPT